MDLTQYLNVLLKRAWLIILIPLIAGVISAAISFYILTPVYEASTTLYVMNKGFDPRLPIAYDDILINQQLVKDYSELIKSRAVTRAVVEQPDFGGLTASKLAASITVNLKNDTRILEIKVRDKEAARAKRLADAVSYAFMGKVIDLMKVENIDVIDEAEVPIAPISPRPALNTSIAVVLGFLSAVGIAILLEFANDTVRTMDDIEKNLGLTVLGTIPLLEMK